MRLIAALRPATRQIHGTLHVAALGRIADALVELHADVAPQLLRDGHIVLGRPEHVGAVVVGCNEAHTLVGELDGVGVAEHLKAAGVGEDGAVPVHELMQAAHLSNEVGTRTHGEVVGVGEHDLRAQVADRLPRDALDRGTRAHRHKDGRLDVAVRRVQHAGAGVRLGVLGNDVVAEERLIHGAVLCELRLSAAASAPRAGATGRRRSSHYRRVPGPSVRHAPITAGTPSPACCRPGCNRTRWENDLAPRPPPLTGPAPSPAGCRTGPIGKRANPAAPRAAAARQRAP